MTEIFKVKIPVQNNELKMESLAMGLKISRNQLEKLEAAKAA